MKRLLALCACLGLVLVATVAVANAGPPATRAYIVVLDNAVPSPGTAATAQGRALGFHVKDVYSHALKGYAANLTATAVDSLSSDPSVAFVAPDEPFAASSCIGVDPSIQQCVPVWGDRIGTPSSSARSGNGHGSVGVNIAVLDSGIDLEHQDLNVAGGTNCVAPGASYDDDWYHGTMVAGIIGAKDNGFGIAGIAPGAPLWAVKVLNSKGTASDSQIICGVDWVTATRTDSDRSNDIAVANMSLGGPGSDDGHCGTTNKDPLHLAICNSVAAGVTYVAGAGNAGKDLRRFVPASYDEVLTATGIADFDGQPGGLAPPRPGCERAGSDDSIYTSSNFATLPADQAHVVAAPAVCISSTYGNATIDNSYGTNSGTSFATPAVTGTVALCIAYRACSGLTPAQIVQKIVSDTGAYNAANPAYGFIGDPLRPISGEYFGYLIHAASY